MLRPVLAPEPPAAPRRAAFALRAVATLALVALVALALAGASARERDRDDYLAEARAAGVGREQLRELAVGFGRETDPARMRIETARVLLNREIDRPGPWSADETTARFGRVEELARQTAIELPAHSRAFSVYASALTQRRTRTADTRYFSLYREWELPLEHAIELDPADRFPKETLSFAYLEVWPAIAPEKRPQVEAVLRAAFQNRGTFNGLIGDWIRIAGSLDAAARLVPDRPWTWRAFVDAAARGDDWPAYTRFSRRYRASIDAETDAAIAEADSRIAANSAGWATQLLDETLKSLPVEAGSATAVSSGSSRCAPPDRPAAARRRPPKRGSTGSSRSPCWAGTHSPPRPPDDSRFSPPATSHPNRPRSRPSPPAISVAPSSTSAAATPSGANAGRPT